jgi:hypothetical protein
MSVSVFGMLNIIFGAFGVLAILLSAPMFFSGGADPKNTTIQVMHQSTTYAAWMVISAVVGALATAALLGAGIAMLQMRPWSRKVSIAYAIYSLVMTPIGAVMQFLFVLPVLIEHAHQQPGPAASAAVNGAIGNMFGSLVGLIYPVLLLIFMTRRNVVAAFEPAAQGAGQQQP